jgi:predicted enzyme related to lactoylglutathione lyase
MGCPVTRWQLVTRNPDRLAAFYGALCGWEIAANNALGYRTVDTGSERGIDGGIWPAPPAAPSFAQLFIEVDDVAATVARATELGARVIVPPQTLPDGDELAVVQDPEGIAFGVMRAAPRDDP